MMMLLKKMILLLLISISPALTYELTLPPQNPDFEALADETPSKIFVHSYREKAAVGLHVLYATTDLDRIEIAYEAAKVITFDIVVHSSAPGGPSIPERLALFAGPVFAFDEALEDNPTLVRSNAFLIETIKTNKALYDLMAKHQTPEARLPELLKLRKQYPAHPLIPTLLAETYWSMGQMERGDFFLNRAMEIAHPAVYWPIAITDAKRVLRRHGYDEALKALEIAADLDYLPGNPAPQIYEDWKLKKLTYDRAPLSTLFLAQQIETLEKRLTKDKDVPGLMALLKLYQNQQKAAEAFKIFELVMKYTDDPRMILNQFLADGGSVPFSKHRVMNKMGKKLLKQYPEDASALLASSFGMKPKKRDETIDKAFILDPKNIAVLKALLVRHRLGGSQPKVTELCDLIVAAEPNAESYSLAMTMAASFDQHERVVLLYREASAKGLVQHTLRNQLAMSLKQLPVSFPFQQEFLEGTYTQARKAYLEGDYVTALELLFPFGFMFHDHSQLNLLTANALQAVNLAVESIPYYEQAVRDFPDDMAVLELLGNAYLADSQFSLAITTFNTLLRLDSERYGIKKKMDVARELAEDMEKSLVSFGSNTAKKWMLWAREDDWGWNPFRKELSHSKRTTFDVKKVEKKIDWDSGAPLDPFKDVEALIDLASGYRLHSLYYEDRVDGRSKLHIEEWGPFKTRLLGSYPDKPAANTPKKDLMSSPYLFRYKQAPSSRRHGDEASYLEVIEQTHHLLK
jgi:tetratricopeptide (TPR) repeat protein